jgi:hypothetical protein
LLAANALPVTAYVVARLAKPGGIACKKARRVQVWLAPANNKFEYLLDPKEHSVIFVSYSRRDKNLVTPLTRLLRASGQKVFLDQEDLEYGGNWKRQLERAIAQSDRFLLFWSKTAKSSRFVAEEWLLALEQPECAIVPILLDRTPLPRELRRFHGTADLEPLFQSLRSGHLFRRVLWLTLLPIALFASFLVVKLLNGIYVVAQAGPPEAGPPGSQTPSSGPNPPDVLTQVLGNLVPCLAVLLAPVLILWVVSLLKRRRLYQRIARKVAVGSISTK